MSPAAPRISTVVLALVALAVAGILIWAADIAVTETVEPSGPRNNYNLLVEGFRSGQLNLKREIPEGFKQLPDPYDPDGNVHYRSRPIAMHDLSYYKGKLYLYFGVTPALLLFWPYVAVTGDYLFHRHAVAIFCVIGYLASLGVLRALWRAYFPTVNILVVALIALGLGLASGWPIFLQRAEFWEVPISAGYALTMLAVGAIWLAMVQPARRVWWTAAASLALGLALGARPSLLFSTVILLIPLVATWKSHAVTARSFWSLIMAVGVPVVLCGIGLMIYNDLRFDSPFEFGQTYQLAGDRQAAVRHFSPTYLWYNIQVYFFHPARWHGQFPFVNEITKFSFTADFANLALPAGHAPAEDPLGALADMPVYLLAAAAPLAWRRRDEADLRPLRGVLGAVGLLFGANALLLCLFYGTCLRYEMEFLPALGLLAGVGTMSLERLLAGRRRALLSFRIVAGVLLLFSLTFNVLATIDRYAEHRTRRGNVLFAAGHVPEAMQLYQEALRIRAYDDNAHEGLGNTLARQGRLQEAVQQYQAALAIDPNRPRTHNNLGDALAALQRPDEAAQHYVAAIQLEPSNPESYCNLGMLMAVNNQPREAIRHFQAALRAAPDYTAAYNDLGNVYLQLGQPQEAIQSYQSAIKLQPDDMIAHYNLGNALAMLSRWNEAAEHFETALRLKPDDLEIRARLEAVRQQLGSPATRR